ncbi:MAG: LacI family transcriptional regulator [Clostridiales bacterium]|nr:LacI family transcriptional regulator [Clostridiales bacterium]
MRIKSKDIAKELHLSEATVSLVLNDREGVSRETRRKVLDYVNQKEKEYYDRERKPKKSRRGLILMLQYIKHGVIFDRQISDWRTKGRQTFNISNNGSESYMDELKEMVEKEGYEFAFVRYDERVHDLDCWMEEWKGHHLRGIYLMGAEMNQNDVLYLSKLSVPIVVGDNNFYDMGIDSYLVDNREGIRRCVDYLVDKGHSKIVYLAESIDIYNFVERRESFLEEMKRRDCGDAQNCIIRLGKNYEEIHMNMLRNIEKGSRRPTAYVLESSLISLGVVQALLESNIRIPNDISLVGFDAVPPVNLSELKLTIVKGTHTRRHRAALKHLMRHIDDNETEITRTYYRTRMQEGNSVFDKTKYIYT